MPSWPAALSLLLALLWFTGRLPLLGSSAEALGAALLAVATVGVGIAIAERLRPAAACGALLAETDA